MTTKVTTCNCLECDICGDKTTVQVVSAIKPSWSEPIYIEEVYWSICKECLDKLDLTANALENY